MTQINELFIFHHWTVQTFRAEENNLHFLFIFYPLFKIISYSISKLGSFQMKNWIWMGWILSCAYLSIFQSYSKLYCFLRGRFEFCMCLICPFRVAISPSSVELLWYRFEKQFEPLVRTGNPEWETHVI